MEEEELARTMMLQLVSSEFDDLLCYWRKFAVAVVWWYNSACYA